MKQLIILCLFLTVLPSTQSRAAESLVPDVWTARQAVDFALRNNPDSLIAGQRILEAQALLAKSRVSFYPQFDLNGSYSQTNNPIHSFGNILNQGQFSNGIDFNDPGRTDNLNLNVGFQYRFYNGGQDRARENAAEAGVEVSAAERKSIQRRLGFTTYRSFQRIVEAEKVNGARLAALKSIRSSLAVARARYDAGDLLKIDLLNLEVQESRALENQIQAVHNLELSKKIFLTLLGLAADDVKINSTAQDNPVLPANPELSQRPELQQLQAALRAAESELRAAHGGKLPTVDGFASYQYDQGYVLDGNGDSWVAGIKVNFKLFDGYSSTANIALAEARLGSLRAEQQKLRLAIKLEIRQAELALSQAQQRQQVTTKMVEQAAESEMLSRAQFKEGVILASDLIDIETRLTDARVRNAVATSAVQIAIADLRRAAGLKQFAGTSNLNPSVENQQ